MKRLVVLVPMVLVACGCPSKPAAPGTGSGTEQGSGPPGGTGPVVSNAKTCDDVKPRVQQLYRVEAEVKEPKRVDEAVADNTAMAMADCAKNPAQTVPCLATAATVAELEKRCLVQLDDEGTEAEQ